MDTLDKYASDGLRIPQTVTNPNTAWLREVNITDLFLFLLKLTVAGLGVCALLAVPVFIIYALLH